MFKKYNSFKVFMTVGLFLVYVYATIFVKDSTIVGITATTLTISLNWVFWIRSKEKPKSLIEV